MDNNFRNTKINKLKNENNKEDNINKISNYNFTVFNNQKNIIIMKIIYFHKMMKKIQ